MCRRQSKRQTGGQRLPPLDESPAICKSCPEALEDGLNARMESLSSTQSATHVVCVLRISGSVNDAKLVRATDTRAYVTTPTRTRLGPTFSRVRK